MKPVPIPESHRDLLDGAYCAALLWRHLPCRTKAEGNARHRQNRADQSVVGCDFQINNVLYESIPGRFSFIAVVLVAGDSASSTWKHLVGQFTISCHSNVG